jgi:FKBP-type peptidyl-prolyl cis-trans isomerase
MATTNAQRAGIWVIAGALTIGTIAGFVAMIIAPQNEAADQKKAEEQYKQMLAEMNKPLKGYEAESFDKDSVKKLNVEILKKGDGKKVEKTSTISANYFGWDANGDIFDSTNVGGTATPREFPLDGVIEGWTKGLTGLPVGSTVELTIPADMAYGDTDNGDGRPVGPLKFIVAIEKIVKE